MDFHDEPPHSTELNKMANQVGVAFYQRFSTSEAAEFLKCSEAQLERLVSTGTIGCLNLPGGRPDFLGFQLAQYLLMNIKPVSRPFENSSSQHKIIGTSEVVELTNLSRTTIWRMEKAEDFPRKIELSARRVGYLEKDVLEWVGSRNLVKL